ncbi:MAG TPA: hypothetical protein VFH78_03820 [Candidatus Thermoplasmatota archaeon]|nr:hypothetical protein [Candidatus Thermoplasmatota archaeon]
MDPSEITGPDKEMREKVARIREKKEHGGTLSRREAGMLGAAGAMEKGAAAEKRAAREGELEEYREEHGTRSWMKGDETRAPRLSDETRREVERIRDKEERGETLTREEAGTLGGAARATNAD